MSNPSRWTFFGPQAMPVLVLTHKQAQVNNPLTYKEKTRDLIGHVLNLCRLIHYKNFTRSNFFSSSSPALFPMESIQYIIK